MSEIKLDIPSITVLIDKGDEYKVIVNKPGTTIRHVTGSFISVADSALTASYAYSASYIAGGTVTSASYANYSDVSAVSSYANTASVATSISFIPNTASYAKTASYVDPLGLPLGTVSSSAQVNTGSFNGSFIGTSSWASNAVTSSFATTSSYVYPSGLPIGTVSSSTQVVANIANQTITPYIVSASIVTSSIVTNPAGNLILAPSASAITSGAVEIRGGLNWKRTPAAVSTEIGDLITFGATVGVIDGGTLTTSSAGPFIVQVSEMVGYTMTTFPYSSHNITKFNTQGTTAASRQLTIPQTSSVYVY